MKQISTSIDIYRLNENGEKEYISKSIHNANSYNNRIGLVEELFGVSRTNEYHKPFKNFECFQIDNERRWGPYKLVGVEVLPEYKSSIIASPDSISAKFNTVNNRRALWFDIGRGGAQINTLTDQIQGTYNFSTTLYDCIPFRLTSSELPEAVNTYGIGLKLTFTNPASGSNSRIERYAYYHKRIKEFQTIIDGPEDGSWDPRQASDNVTDTTYVDPANIGLKDITIAIKATGEISTSEVTEFYQFLNGTSAGAFVNEIGIVTSPIKVKADDNDINNPLTDWDNCELFSHLESNRFDMSGSKSNVSIDYTFYFN